MDKVVQAIWELYMTDNGAAGGYGHIVFDDENMEDNHIDFCIKEAGEGDKYGLGEECRKASLKALTLFREVPFEKRKEVLEKAVEKIYGSSF